MLTTVVFDADETLIDLRPAVDAGLRVVLAEMRRLTPAADEVSFADIAGDWDAVYADLVDEPVMRIRRAALARSLARVGLTDELDRMAELFFARRFALSRPFDDALPMLGTLRRSYVLGFATNGNSRADRCGLAAEFSFEVYAHVRGVPKKPSPAFFAAVLAEAGVAPSSVVHVGDSPDKDVQAAQEAGLRGVWLNRDGLPRPPGLRPDAEVRSLAELPSVLERWQYS
ncbi:HAD family hydrolase [Plantactinospora soyae]|uniref:Hydrolase of the HAD superfamily n=1 Tax=Plantactinospora soyae TaxID=1544732 RepID=A0A927M8T7_9ACTN|nr:HAD family hydrolase [Plantactinospora soyae]MBE1486580.1 putative hydrolase of the HAD superfamily [Plantactinospora soyae]